MATHSTTSPLALITGASAGIGQELARVFAREGYDLVLVARREDRLNDLAAELESAHGNRAHVLPFDLAEPEAPQRLYDQLQQQNLSVEVLVNNAGFGSYGPFHTLDLQRELKMIQLNVAALTHLTHLFLGPMVKRGSGRILNVASTAAFQPGPLMATYYATKAFVVSFSEALAEELGGTGVTVTALCPGPTRSEFQAAAQMEKSRLAKNFLMEAQPVAELAYQGTMRGRRLVIPGMINKLTAQSHRFTPRKLMTKIVRQIQARGD